MIRRISTTIRTRLSRSWRPLKRNKRLRIKISAGVAFALFGAWLWLGPLPERVRDPGYSRVVTARDGTLLRAYLSRDEKWRFRVDSALLPAHISESLLCLEDKRFRSHLGIDPFALARAVRQNLSSRRVISGGSTITMQLARLASPRARTLFAKSIEGLRALQLEARLSKKEILDLYLSLAPFGSNIEGLEAAAHRYFLKPARLLAPSEIAFLLVLPQSPRRWGAATSARLTALRDRNLEKMRACGILTEQERARFALESIPAWRPAFETHAAHFADFAGMSSGVSITTTIDGTLQRSLEALVRENEARLRELGIVNVGLLAVDNLSGELRAAIGNFDFNREGDAQKVTSFLAYRSPGSLLKPFLYGRLLEAGELLPESLLEDVPFDVDDYEPKNYDGEFNGLIEARLALANSLNVPWIKKLSEHGVEPFLAYMLESGMKTPQKREDLGLSLAIGGMETRLLDLVMLYRALARDGELRSIHWLETPAGASGAASASASASASIAGWRWLHPGAAHLVREALKIRGRPDFAIDPKYLQHSQLRWKTGTSQGNHDAWAIGFDPEITIGVWLGNLDNRPSPSLVGPEVAAPLMFDAHARARKQAPSLAADWVGSGLEMIEVCAFSGLPATDACPHRKETLGLKGLEVRHRCPYHQNVLVDLKTGMRITKDCERPGMRPEVRSALELPPDVADWARRNLSGREVAPPFHPACATRPVAEGKLKILTPEATTYVLHSGLVEAKKELRARAPGLTIPLRLKTASPLHRTRCYLDGKFLGEGDVAASALAPSIHATLGEHVLLCSDEQGRSDQVAFAVE